MAINFQPWKNVAQLKKLEKVRGCVYCMRRVRKYNRGRAPIVYPDHGNFCYDKNTCRIIEYTFFPVLLRTACTLNETHNLKLTISFPRFAAQLLIGADLNRS